MQQAQPQVRVEQAQPQVRVEQQAQPQVRVEQSDRAQVRVEQQSQAGSTANTRAGAPSTGTATAGGGATAAGVPLQRVSRLVGTNVVAADGRNVGEIENLLVDAHGNVRAAVIEWGGFLGMGEHRAVLPIEQVQLPATEGERARVRLTREQLEALPRYERGRLADYGREHGWGEVRLAR